MVRVLRRPFGSRSKNQAGCQKAFTNQAESCQIRNWPSSVSHLNLRVFSTGSAVHPVGVRYFRGRAGPLFGETGAVFESLFFGFSVCFRRVRFANVIRSVRSVIRPFIARFSAGF